MLLIHTPRLTNRLGYTLNVILGRMLHVDFSITTDESLFLASTDAKLSYGPKRIGDTLHIKSCHLLYETSIEEQDPHAQEIDGLWTLFPVYGRDLDFSFDIFAATFYLISRYEEYLPHREDEHGRFCSTESIAAQAGFLHLPVVDQWTCLLRDKLLERYPDLKLPQRTYRFVQTVDIDAAWSYLHKGMFRTTMGWIRDLVSRKDFEEVRLRWRVLTHKEADPFDTFDYIIKQSVQIPDAQLIFFALVAEYGQYDKPSHYLNPHTRELFQHLDDYANMGIHPGYHTIDEPQKIDTEIKRLEQILHRPIVRSRYHFLRLKLPQSYRILLRAGIQDDYTMGYADVAGFRAGTSSPYPFYDLERDHETELIINPFCVMDTTLQKYMKQKPDEAVEEYRKLIEAVRNVGGTFCCIVHNQNLCDIKEWKGWRETYEKMLNFARP